MDRIGYMQVESNDGDEEPDLMELEVWITDTGATAHNTVHEIGATNIMMASQADYILGVTGPPARANKIVDIPCVLVEARGKKKQW